MRITRLRLHSLILTLVLGVSLMLSTFAHRMPAVEDTAMARFVMAGGDLADICNDSGDAKKHVAGCDACRIVGGTLMPAPVLCPIAVERIIAATVLIPAETRANRVPRDPALGARASPLA